MNEFVPITNEETCWVFARLQQICKRNKKKHGTIVSTEDAGQGRMCATNSLIVFTFLDGLEASPPETQQGVVISATSGLLFHISQLGGNQIRSDEPRSTHKPVWPHRLT